MIESSPANAKPCSLCEGTALTFPARRKYLGAGAFHEASAYVMNFLMAVSAVVHFPKELYIESVIAIPTAKPL
jgi:hypothetical protein